MVEGSHENLDGGEGGSEKIDFQKMKFEHLEQALKEVRELAATSFKQSGDEFYNAEGHGMSVSERNGVWRIAGINRSLRRVHEYVGGGHRGNPILTQGSSNKEEVIQAVREMLEELGNRIIE